MAHATARQNRAGRVVAFVQVVKVSVKAASRPAVLENLRELFKAFLSMFDLCATHQDADVSLLPPYPMAYHLINLQVESNVTSAFLEVVVKLNETAFRPIFRKMFDWPFTQSHGAQLETLRRLHAVLIRSYSGTYQITDESYSAMYTALCSTSSRSVFK